MLISKRENASEICEWKITTTCLQSIVQVIQGNNSISSIVNHFLSLFIKKEDKNLQLLDKNTIFFFNTVCSHVVGGRALIVTARLLLCDRKVTGLSPKNSLSAKSRGKAAYDNRPSPNPHKARSLVHQGLPFMFSCSRA